MCLRLITVNIESARWTNAIFNRTFRKDAYEFTKKLVLPFEFLSCFVTIILECILLYF